MGNTAKKIVLGNKNPKRCKKCGYRDFRSYYSGQKSVSTLLNEKNTIN